MSGPRRAITDYPFDAYDTEIDFTVEGPPP
jgi:hypothetical protein